MLTKIIWVQEGMFSGVFDGVEHDVHARFVSFVHFWHFLEITFFKIVSLILRLILKPHFKLNFKPNFKLNFWVACVWVFGWGGPN